MKYLIITTAIIGALSAAAVQAETKDVLDCEIKLVPGTNYYNKTDANCAFDVIGGGAGPGDLSALTPVVTPPEEEPEEPPVEEPPAEEPPADPEPVAEDC